MNLDSKSADQATIDQIWLFLKAWNIKVGSIPLSETTPQDLDQIVNKKVQKFVPIFELFCLFALKLPQNHFS